MIFLHIIHYQTKTNAIVCRNYTFQRNERFYVTWMLHQGFPNLESVFLDSGKIGSRKNCSAASCLPCWAQLRATFKIRLCPSQHSGYSEILRGRVKPAQLRFYEGTVYPNQITFNCFPNITVRNDYNTKRRTRCQRRRKTRWRYDRLRNIQERAPENFSQIFREKSGEWKRIPFYPRGNADPSRARCSFRHGETYNAGNPSSREVANSTP